MKMPRGVGVAAVPSGVGRFMVKLATSGKGEYRRCSRVSSRVMSCYVSWCGVCEQPPGHPRQRNQRLVASANWAQIHPWKANFHFSFRKGNWEFPVPFQARCCCQGAPGRGWTEPLFLGSVI
ncbi:uncharacterized protein WM294_008594 isoform 2-T3 [Sarcoramphus papa]